MNPKLDTTACLAFIVETSSTLSYQNAAQGTNMSQQLSALRVASSAKLKRALTS